MKTPFFFSALFLGLFALTGCGDATEQRPISVDSTNQTGAAPVQPAEGSSSVIVDTTTQARDNYRRDTLGDRAGGTEPTGRGTNTSNTSDARTTSGSANNGDADRDRKK